MTPPGEVTWGTSVDVTCSISTQHVGGTFTLQKTSGSFTKTQSSSSKSATFNIQRVNFDHEGFYQCQYHTTVSTRAFSSPQSDSLRLSVTGKDKNHAPPQLNTTCCQNNTDRHKLHGRI
uniref:Immunoglobulin-like beta-sandwich domain-containing protein n=1 Tax=Sphaeramia orbicularis TaxID=375764 RepID=A0A672YB57_9TELE